MPTLSSEFAMWFILGGIIILLLSAILEALWEFGRQVKPELRPAFLDTAWKHVILFGWVVLLIAGGAMLLWAEALVSLIAIVVYWLILPLVVGSRVRRRFLPPWEDLRDELEKQGYTERNYWRRGDWWKAKSKAKFKSDSKSST